jgi:hypothetical protein
MGSPPVDNGGGSLELDPLGFGGSGWLKSIKLAHKSLIIEMASVLLSVAACYIIIMYVSQV